MPIIFKWNVPCNFNVMSSGLQVPQMHRMMGKQPLLYVSEASSWPLQKMLLRPPAKNFHLTVVFLQLFTSLVKCFPLSKESDGQNWVVFGFASLLQGHNLLLLLQLFGQNQGPQLLPLQRSSPAPQPKTFVLSPSYCGTITYKIAHNVILLAVLVNILSPFPMYSRKQKQKGKEFSRPSQQINKPNIPLVVVLFEASEAQIAYWEHLLIA